MVFVSILVAFAFAVVAFQSFALENDNGCDIKFMNVSNEILTGGCEDLQVLANSALDYKNYSDCIMAEYGKSLDTAITTCVKFYSVNDMDFTNAVKYGCRGTASENHRKLGICCVITELTEGKDFSDADVKIKLSKCIKSALGKI